jgi:hypothetical protein
MNELNWNPSTRELRGFSLIAMVFFGALGAWILLSRDPGGAWLCWVVGVAFGLPGLLRPASVRLVFVLFSVATKPISWIVSHLILVILFYGVITPTGLLLRLFARETLDLAGDPARSSYWMQRTASADDERYLRQS